MGINWLEVANAILTLCGLFVVVGGAYTVMAFVADRLGKWRAERENR